MATALETETSTSSRNTRTVVTETEKPSRKKFVLPIVAVLALLILFWAFQKWSYGRSHQSTDNAQVDGHIVPVLAKVGGYVKSVAGKEKEHVNAGQLPFPLHDAHHPARFQQAGG